VLGLASTTSVSTKLQDIAQSLPRICEKSDLAMPWKVIAIIGSYPSSGACPYFPLWGLVASAGIAPPAAAAVAG
jgi:hypothetical protein